MTKPATCVNPLAVKEYQRLKEDTLIMFYDETKIECMNEVKPYWLDFEPSNICAGSCSYCFSSSTSDGDIIYPKEKVEELIDESYKLGTRFISWGGGDPLLHPNWDELIRYSAEKGLKNLISTSGLVSKAQARELRDLGDSVTSVGHHIDTINQEAYNQSHFDPKTREMKMRGLYNLLEAGIPGEKLYSCITVTRQAAQTIEETLDWLVDEMGIRDIIMMQFKPEGFGQGRFHMEPSLSDSRKALEYRTRKLGEKWLRIGSGDGDKFICRTIFGVTYTGDVVPCVTLNRPVGNVFQESLPQIMERHRDTLFYNFEVKGPCKECDNSDICWGCRVTAYHYTGDVEASDPKCFMNHEAQEYYMEGNLTG